MNAKTLVLPVLVCAVIGLTGCGASEAPSASPSTSPSVNPNAAACTGFVQETGELANRMVAGAKSSGAEFKQSMSEMPARFDNLGLKSAGDVKARIETLIDNLPDPVTMLFLNHKEYFDDVASVQRACAAENIEIDPVIWK